MTGIGERFASSPRELPPARYRESEVVDQPRLADARFTGHEHNLASRRGTDVFRGPEQQGQRFTASNDRRHDCTALFDPLNGTLRRCSHRPEIRAKCTLFA